MDGAKEEVEALVAQSRHTLSCRGCHEVAGCEDFHAMVAHFTQHKRVKEQDCRPCFVFASFWLRHLVTCPGCAWKACTEGQRRRAKEKLAEAVQRRELQEAADRLLAMELG